MRKKQFQTDEINMGSYAPATICVCLDINEMYTYVQTAVDFCGMIFKYKNNFVLERQLLSSASVMNRDQVFKWNVIN